ncbi:MAG: NfeD family protein [Opitutales bacterium]
MPLPYALALIALVLLVVEIVAPGGILFVAGLLLLIASSIILGVEEGFGAGLLMFLGTLVVTSIVFFIELKILRTSTFLRFIRLEDKVAGHTRNEPARQTLIGAEGRTVTTLAPLGKVDIAGEIHEASSQGEMLSAETPVQVVAVEAYRLVVRPRAETSEGST